MSTYYLAVDGGGTKTEVICADESGSVVGRGISGPTNLTSTSVGAASFNLIEAVRQAVETLPRENSTFACLAMGLAGIDSPKEEYEAEQIFTRALSHYAISKFILVNDSIIALKNGSSAQNAVVVIAGTGSICYGQTQKGAVARAAGMDFLLADQGSGYAIGRRVLREAVKSYDGRAQKSALEQLVCDYFKIPSIAELKNHVYNPPLGKIEIAQLAPLCSDAFAVHDPAAQAIFTTTAQEIIDMIAAVVSRLELKSVVFDCVCSGSILKIPNIQELVLAFMRTTYPSAHVIFPEKDPVFGALKLALQQ